VELIEAGFVRGEATTEREGERVRFAQRSVEALTSTCAKVLRHAVGYDLEECDVGI